jgi:chorismate synthase
MAVTIFALMASNYLGKLLRFTTFGESHGSRIGGIVDGFPAGIPIDMELIQFQLSRRKPGQSALTSPRSESDEVEILSGVFDGISTGAPIGFQIVNKDKKSGDYDHLKEVYRPSHADFTYAKKYGIRDHRGGGRSSARETANWVVCGSLARHLLHDIKIHSYVEQIGPIICPHPWEELDLRSVDQYATRCPDLETSNRMTDWIEKMKEERDSTGGVIRCVVTGLEVGLGEPIFGKVQARLGEALFSLNAVKGVEFGTGFQAAAMRGSEHNDVWKKDKSMKSNHAGGILGGITTGEPLHFRLAFKPTATIGKAQTALNQKNETITLEAQGRHDPCVVPRAVPIVDALTAFVLADLMLENKTRRP